MSPDAKVDALTDALALVAQLNDKLAELEIPHAILVGRILLHEMEVHAKSYGSASDVIAFAHTAATMAAEPGILEVCSCKHCKLEHEYAKELAKQLAGHRTLVHGSDHMTKN